MTSKLLAELFGTFYDPAINVVEKSQDYKLICCIIIMKYLLMLRVCQLLTCEECLKYF